MPRPSPSRGPELSLRRAAFLVAGLALIASAPSLDNRLVHDDVVLVGRDARVTEPGHLAEIWTTDYWPGGRPSYLYRPVTTTSFALLARVGGGQRAANAALHAAASVLVLALLLELGLGVAAATLGGALFAVHPIHAEAIHLVVGRAELLAAVFGMAFLLLVLRGRGLLSAACAGLAFALAVFSKESAVMLPVLAILLRPLHAATRARPGVARHAMRALGAAAPGLVALVAARHATFATFLAPPGFVSELYNPIAALEPGLRVVNAAWLLLAYCSVMLVPVGLSADHSLGSFRLITSAADARVAVLLAACVLTCAVIARPAWRSSAEARGAAFAMLALLPVSNLAFVAGVAFADRLAYLPSAGACLALAAGWQRWHERGSTRKWACGAGVVLLVTGLGLSLQRGKAWQDPEAFTRALVRDAPTSATAHGWRAVHLAETGRTQEAEAEIRRALAIAPAWHDAWDTLGDLLAARGAAAEAAEAWTRAAKEAARSVSDRGDAAPLYFRAAGAWLTARDCSRARASAAAARAELAGAAPTALIELERRLSAEECGLRAAMR